MSDKVDGVDVVDEVDRQELIGLENEFAVGQDGWLKIAPYGRSLKERIARGADGRAEQQSFEQVLDKPAAEEMVRKFNSLWGRVKRFVVGVPIYRNHPDLTRHSPETIVPTAGLANEANACGMFAALEAREDGFYGRPIVSKEGQTAIERDGLKWISPFWWVKGTEVKNGIRIVRPTELISAGLTKYPNIPGGEALANSRVAAQQEQTEQTEREIMKREQIIAALKKAGIALANEAGATDEQILQAFDGLVAKTAVTALENEATSVAATAATALSNEKTARAQAEKELGETRTALANERKARIDLVLDGAIGAGKITIAERGAWLAKLETGFDANLTALANEAVKVKTVAITGGAGIRKEEGATQIEASDKVTALANERMAKTGVDWPTAWKQIKKENPALFEAMAGKV